MALEHVVFKNQIVFVPLCKQSHLVIERCRQKSEYFFVSLLLYYWNTNNNNDNKYINNKNKKKSKDLKKIGNAKNCAIDLIKNFHTHKKNCVLKNTIKILKETFFERKSLFNTLLLDGTFWKI